LSNLIIRREGPQAVSPPFNSAPSKPIRDVAKMEEILGPDAFDDAFFQAGRALFGEAESYTMYAILYFNTQDRAILTFYDQIEQPVKIEDWAPKSWRKKFPDDGGEMYQRAVKIMKWS